MMHIIDCIQGSDEWRRAHLGIPTSSEFKTIVGVKKDARDKLTRRTYMLKLAGEILTGDPRDSYSNQHMDRGNAMEDEARNNYAFMTDLPLTTIGFIRNGNTGCSPDSLIDRNGALELKTALPHILADLILRDAFPPEHRLQCQGVLWIAEREWIDIHVYWPRMPYFCKRTYRDEACIKELTDAVDQFNAELNDMVEQLRNYGGQNAKAA